MVTQRDPQTALALEHDPALAGLAAWIPASWAVAADWQPLVAQFFASSPAGELGSFVTRRLDQGVTVYPAQPLRALALTPLSRVKVLVLGQDPYHAPGQAHGLAFSVAPGVRVPPSLRNIRAEIERERHRGTLVGADSPKRDAVAPSGDLSYWAEQGVLLLNTCLTVEKASPGSHAGRGWEALTDALIAAVMRKSDPVALMLWGFQAQSRLEKMADVANSSHKLVLKSNHPSPLSAKRAPVPFVGCGHFGIANAFLQRHGSAPIDW